MIDAGLSRAALVCVDIQDGERGPEMTPEALPALWRELGFTAEDVNAAARYAWDVALPNAVRAAAACRRAGLPCIFLHWGFRMPDGRDLDPETYATLRAEHGADARTWPGWIGDPHSQPARALGVRPEEYVLAKTAQDAFGSSALGFLLRNLGVETLLFIGGHTEACLGKTARSARAQGYRTVCVADATNNARESTRLAGIAAAGFDAVIDTARLEALVGAALPGA